MIDVGGFPMRISSVAHFLQISTTKKQAASFDLPISLVLED
jgi:hypothetical protein